MPPPVTDVKKAFLRLSLVLNIEYNVGLTA